MGANLATVCVSPLVLLSGVYAGHFSGHQAIDAVGLCLPALSTAPPRAWPTCGWKGALAWVGVPAFCASGSFQSSAPYSPSLATCC